MSCDPGRHVRQTGDPRSPKTFVSFVFFVVNFADQERGIVLNSWKTG